MILSVLFCSVSGFGSIERFMQSGFDRGGSYFPPPNNYFLLASLVFLQATIQLVPAFCSGADTASEPRDNCLNEQDGNSTAFISTSPNRDGDSRECYITIGREVRRYLRDQHPVPSFTSHQQTRKVGLNDYDNQQPPQRSL